MTGVRDGESGDEQSWDTAAILRLGIVAMTELAGLLDLDVDSHAAGDVIDPGDD